MMGRINSSIKESLEEFNLNETKESPGTPKDHERINKSPLPKHKHVVETTRNNAIVNQFFK